MLQCWHHECEVLRFELCHASKQKIKVLSGINCVIKTERFQPLTFEKFDKNEKNIDFLVI